MSTGIVFGQRNMVLYFCKVFDLSRHRNCQTDAITIEIHRSIALLLVVINYWQYIVFIGKGWVY